MADRDEPAAVELADNRPPYRVVSIWLQVAGIVAIVAMGIINATIAQQQIPTTIFILVAALSIGIDPERFVDLFRGRRSG